MNRENYKKRSAGLGENEENISSLRNSRQNLENREAEDDSEKDTPNENNTSVETDSEIEALQVELDNKRDIYAEEFIKTSKIKNKWNEFKQFFTGKNSLEKKKFEWFAARHALIKKLVDRKKEEIGEIDTQEKADEILSYEQSLNIKSITEEQAQINTARAEALSQKRKALWEKALSKTMGIKKLAIENVKSGTKYGLNLWKKTGDWGPILIQSKQNGNVIYQYKLGQLVRSGLIFGAIGAPLGAAAFGIKIARSVSIGMGGAYGLAQNEKVLKNKLAQYKENSAGLSAEELEKKKRKAKILHNSMKVVIVGLMVGGNIASAQIENNLFAGSGADIEDHTNTPEKNHDNTPGAPDEESKIGRDGRNGLGTGKDEDTIKVDVSERGAIATIENLKSQLKLQYPNVNDAPENIKHILNTNSVTLSQEWGMFNPDEIKESAMMLKGSTITVDQNGNITLHNLGKGDTVLSGEGSEKYSGNMFDSDHSGDTENTNSENLPNRDTDMIDRTGDDEDLPDESELHEYDDFGNRIDQDQNGINRVANNTNTQDNLDTPRPPQDYYNSDDMGTNSATHPMYRDYLNQRQSSRYEGTRANDSGMSTSNYGMPYSGEYADQNVQYQTAGNIPPTQEQIEILSNQQFQGNVDQIFGKQFLGAPMTDGTKSDEWLYLKDKPIMLDDNGGIKLTTPDGEIGLDKTTDDVYGISENDGRMNSVLKRLTKLIENSDTKPNGQTLEQYLKQISRTETR